MLEIVIQTPFLPSKWNLNFWPKNDSEKWSRQIHFEIPPCGKMVIFITECVILGPFFEVWENSFPHGGISK